MTPHLHVRLVNPSELVLSRINLTYLGGRLELRIDRTARVDPAVQDALRAMANRALTELVSMANPRRPPIVRYYLESGIPGGLVHADLSPYQADIYLERGLMPQDLADELAAHSTFLLRRITLCRRF
ncbi:hypothetical protein [Nonomuraea dietziae]|uniref:hypothetical protein n=1 Tax=Nonomuraea dietziae TaxID=65515 RepID=UPI003412116E